MSSERLSRSPHGERGLKYKSLRSHVGRNGRSPHGERGLKSNRPHRDYTHAGRSPHGERGLKSGYRDQRRRWREVALLTESVD